MYSIEFLTIECFAFLLSKIGDDNMPRKTLMPCKHPSCPQLTNQRFCDRHRHRHERASASERDYDHKWRHARTKYLKEHPLCVKCQVESRLIKATVVDHIIPHRGDGKLFWDKSN